MKATTKAAPKRGRGRPKKTATTPSKSASKKVDQVLTAPAAVCCGNDCSSEKTEQTFLSKIVSAVKSLFKI